MFLQACTQAGQCHPGKCPYHHHRTHAQCQNQLQQRIAPSLTAGIFPQQLRRLNVKLGDQVPQCCGGRHVIHPNQLIDLLNGGTLIVQHASLFQLEFILVHHLLNQFHLRVNGGIVGTGLSGFEYRGQLLQIFQRCLIIGLFSAQHIILEIMDKAGVTKLVN